MVRRAAVDTMVHGVRDGLGDVVVAKMSSTGGKRRVLIGEAVSA